MTSPLFLNEGTCIDDSGHTVTCCYVNIGSFQYPELIGDWPLPLPRLVKGHQEQDGVGVCGKVRLSRPERFRLWGERLIGDPGEMRHSLERVLEERADDSADLQKSRMVSAELNKGAELVGSGLKRTTKSVRVTRKNTRTLTVGDNCLMWSTSIEPDNAEQWKLWKRDLKESYGHLTPVLSPRRLARELGLLVLHEFGPQEVNMTIRDTTSGVVTQLSGVMVFHGPVVYADDPFGFAKAASGNDSNRVLRPMFVKHTEFRHQREYRFVVLTKVELEENHVDLRVTPGLLSALGSTFAYDANLPTVPASVGRRG